MEGNKGITLVALIITIILMTILASVTITYGVGIYENNKVHRFVAQLQMIQKKVDNYAEELKFLKTEAERETKIVEDLSPSDSKINNGKSVSEIITSEGLTGNSNDFKYFTVTDLEEKFQIDNIDEEIVFAINFKTREVINTTGEEYKGATYYTQYKNLPGSQNLIQHVNEGTALDLTYEVQCLGLNSKIVVNISNPNTVLSYGLNTSGTLYNENVDKSIPWIIKSNHTVENETYEIPITKAGSYVVKIEDVDGNTKAADIEIVLNNSPKLDETLTPIDVNENIMDEIVDIEEGSWYNYESGLGKWAFAKKTSQVYVWIPRFVYNNSTGKIKYLKGNSNIPTDGEDVNLTPSSDWKLPSQFGTYPNSLTGIWVEIKNGDNKSNLRPSIKDIFTDTTFNLQSREILVID
jgi:type II secretory pathway pseudopilin PulG